MGIKITNPKSKMPRAYKLIGHISSYLFEEELGECGYMKQSEIKALRAGAKALGRAAARTSKMK